jgi:hypothetical protein
MSYAEQLIEMATDSAMDAKDSAATLQRQLAEMELAKREIEARLHAASLALKRLGTFVVERGSDFQCPYCWINNETAASLRLVGDGTQSGDLFRCDTCEGNFTLNPADG